MHCRVTSLGFFLDDAMWDLLIDYVRGYDEVGVYENYADSVQVKEVGWYCR